MPKPGTFFLSLFILNSTVGARFYPFILSPCSAFKKEHLEHAVIIPYGIICHLHPLLGMSRVLGQEGTQPGTSHQLLEWQKMPNAPATLLLCLVFPCGPSCIQVGQRLFLKQKLKRNKAKRKSSCDPHQKILKHKFCRSWADANEVYCLFNNPMAFQIITHSWNSMKAINVYRDM